MLVELSELQDQEVGDGTTSVVIIAAELLKVRCNRCRAPQPRPCAEASGGAEGRCAHALHGGAATACTQALQPTRQRVEAASPCARRVRPFCLDARRQGGAERVGGVQAGLRLSRHAQRGRAGSGGEAGQPRCPRREPRHWPPSLTRCLTVRPYRALARLRLRARGREQRANELVREGIHPTTIMSGYRLAMREGVKCARRAA